MKRTRTTKKQSLTQIHTKQLTSSSAFESSFRDHREIPPMSISHGVIAVVRELLETESAFFRTAVALPEPQRGRAIGNRARMTHDILSLMRLMVSPPPTTQRFVVNIPLRESDMNAFEDVPILPTADHLAAALEHEIPFNDSNCAICQESVEMGTRLRNCGHGFHSSCITNWFSMNPRCPVCRDDVRVPRPTRPPGSSASDEESH